MFKFFKKIKNALTSLFSQPIDEATFAKLEQILYEADLGAKTAHEFAQKLRTFLKKNSSASSEEIFHFLQTEALQILNQPPKTAPSSGHPHVVLVVGVNGSGKTTSIAKLANFYQKAGKKVVLAAADTFRAAAIDQLTLWAEKLHLDIVKAQPGSDPSAVVFDALSAAKTRGSDVVLIDTAGRLQNKTDLMHELEKIRRVCHKVVPGSPHEILLTLDATTGQNSLDQARAFHQFTPLTGILLSKLDGSAKGGIIFAIYRELGIPVQWIGSGEKASDFEPFDPTTYVKTIF